MSRMNDELLKGFKMCHICMKTGSNVFLSGGIANVYAGQPLDTVKVKVQTFPHLYNSWVTCLKDTFKSEGVRGLYAGNTS